ncbi:MAG: hypothetical protein AB7J13_08785 [Pyrinomonadaceae bacterium]
MNGTAREAIIEGPSSVTVDRGGNRFIASFLGHRVYKVDSKGLITLVAGTGKPDSSGDGGPSIKAAINGPSAVIVVRDDLYISEQLGDRIRRIDSAGVIHTIAGGGRSGNSADGIPAFEAALSQPAGMAYFSGELYFTEFAGNKVRKVSKDGIIRTVAGTGQRASTGDGTAALRSAIQAPTGIAIDRTGNIYFSEIFSGRVRRIDKDGTISTVAGLGKPEDPIEGRPAKNVNLRGPHGLVFDHKGNLYVAEFAGNHVYRIDTRSIITTFAGAKAGRVLRRTAPAMIENPVGLGIDAKGNLFAALFNQGKVVKINPLGAISIIAGEKTPLEINVRRPTEAYLKGVGGVAADSDGNVYIAEAFGNSVRKLTPDGRMTIFSGNGLAVSSGDGRSAASAGLNHPVGIIPSGKQVFIVEADGNRIRMVSDTGRITTIAGTGQPGFSGDGGFAEMAGCNHPHYGDTFGNYTYPANVGLMLRTSSRSNATTQDSGAFMVFVDTNNNRVRKIDSRGIVTTVAGNGSLTSSGDGGLATRAGINRPEDVVVDKDGNLYISEAHRVRKVDTKGIITTIAGTGRRGFSGNGGKAIEADLDSPYGLAIDERDLYIADSWNNVVWKVDVRGIITLVAGDGKKRSAGDGGRASESSLNAPIDLAILRNDQGVFLLIAELEGGRVRSVRLR